MTKDERRAYDREWKRQRGLKDPEWREADKQRKKVYYQQNKDRVKGKAAEYRKNNADKIKAIAQSEEGKAYHREWMKADYAAKKEKYRNRSHDNYHKDKESIKAQRRLESFDSKASCVDYLGGKCVSCGESFHQSKFQFHHVNPSEKSFAISAKLGNGWSLKRLQPELDKCVLMCANCHSYVEWIKRHPGLK